MQTVDLCLVVPDRAVATLPAAVVAHLGHVDTFYHAGHWYITGLALEATTAAMEAPTMGATVAPAAPIQLSLL